MGWVVKHSYRPVASRFGYLEATLGGSELANYVWNGSTNTDWLTPPNWTPTGTPSANDDVIIPDASTTPNDPMLPVGAMDFRKNHN
ncbi:MAG: hypothetical protein IPP15_22550 [Saprospiraceae bacterium]|uniref:Uncharacterized protein n=1 Tax=Candidatus Opimibacter skivensis TaxID=2982028 RepID=A0A9D7SZK9_9BACT|nr:hypothetical protein [Candidatus Opimibacter skivensis]